MDVLHTRVDSKLIFWETFKKRHFTERKMATIIGMVQILNKDSTLTNKKGCDRRDCLMMMQSTFWS